MKRVTMAATFAVALAVAPMAQAQDEAPDIAAMLEKVEMTATSLNDRVAGMGSKIADSGNSEELGRQLMDDMLAAARDVVAAVDSESELWVDINELMKIWAANRDSLVERGVEESPLMELATEWQAKIDEASELRKQLIDQSAEGKGLIEQIEAQREYIIELYKLKMADRVLGEMRAMSEELGEMNATMTEIRDTARAALSDDGVVVPQ